MSPERVNKFEYETMDQYLEIAESLAHQRIMVVGDIGLDEYIVGQVKRISPEAPVPVVEVEKSEFKLGLSANVAQNIVGLGGEPVLISVVGQDGAGDQLRHILESEKTTTQYLITDTSRPTTRKSRVIAEDHHICRVDYEQRKYIQDGVQKSVLGMISENMAAVDAVIVQDYAKGLISKNIVSNVCQMAKQAGKKVLLDPHRSQTIDVYQGINLFKPNFDEAVALSGIGYDDVRDNDDVILKIGDRLLQTTGAEEMVMTRGKDGMLIFNSSGVNQVPTFARNVYDVTGAGDTVIAALAMGAAKGLETTRSCVIANFAAGFVVGKVGCIPCTTEDLKSYIRKLMS